jgi:hypothetical protein
MKQQAGVWIDHRKALIVTVTPDGEHTALIISHVETQARRAGDSPLKGPYEHWIRPPDDRVERALTKHLNMYYDAVIAAIRGAERILLIGPGEAKGELKKRLAKVQLGKRVAATETAARMTDRQVIAKVRKYFGLNAPRREPRARPQVK